MSLFTPVTGITGGSLVGLSAATLLLGAGQILGASGICTSLVLSPRKTLLEPSQQWKIAFLASFVVTVKMWAKLSYQSLFDPRLGMDPELAIVSPIGNMVAGFLVGFGTKTSNGCTTGHGICGLARFSKRSMAAVSSFMITGIFSATICGSQCPLAQYTRARKELLPFFLPDSVTTTIGTIVASVICGSAIPSLLPRLPRTKKVPAENKHTIYRDRQGPAIFSGIIFAAGLSISGMVKPSKIYGFLDMTSINRGTYDPTLLCVMGAGMFTSWCSYQFVKGYRSIKLPFDPLDKPPLHKSPSAKFDIPTNKKIDFDLFFGGGVFGLGWGIGGLCPGPAMFLAVAGFPNILYYWWPSFFVGSFVAQVRKERKSMRSSK